MATANGESEQEKWRNRGGEEGRRETLQVKTTLLEIKKEFSWSFAMLHCTRILHPLTGDISVTVKSWEFKI